MPSPEATTSNLSQDLNRLRIERGRKRAPRLRWLRNAIVFVVALGVVAGLAAWRQRNTAIEVRTTRAELEAITEDGYAPALTASGYVIPRNQVDVSSKIIGRVKEVLVERGSQVRAGDVLVRLEDEEYQAQVAQAEANVGAARAALAELRAGSRPQEVAAARAQSKSAEAQLENARRDRDRFEELRADGVVSQQEYDRVRLQHEVAEAALTATRKQFELVDIGPRIERINAAEAQLRQAEASLEYARTQLSFTILTAPISGTILEKVADQGELLTNQDFGGTRGAKSAAVSMADLNDLQVEIDLNENQVPKVQPEQPCLIELDSVPDELFRGKVDEIAPQADRQKGTVQVKVRILNPKPAVRPEMNALVTFLLQVPAGEGNGPRVWISKSAIRQENGKTVVYVAEGELARRRPIRQGEEGQRGIRVLEGLQGGETLINDPPGGLKDGKKIKLAS